MITRDITYQSSVDGTGPLHAFVALPEEPGRHPVIAVMHGFAGTHRHVAASCERLARKGFLAVGPDMRGRGESAGAWDIGAVEIHDIVDGVRAALQAFPQAGDPANINILGYSGGGGNVFSAVTRFPTLFRVGVSFFGISDYGWWHDHNAAYAPKVAGGLGGTPAQLPDVYAVRNSLDAVVNAPDTRLHLFWDSEEKTCPAYFNTEYARRAAALGYTNVHLHESRPGDADRWIHGYPDDNSALARAEDLFLPEIRASRVPAPTLRPEGRLVVPGYLITPQLSIWLGDGRAAVAEVAYRFTPGDGISLRFTPRIAAAGVRARVRVDLSRQHQPAVVEIDGATAATLAAGPCWEKADLSLACEVRIRPAI